MRDSARITLERLQVLADAVRRLGPRWVLFRLKYRVQRTLGVHEKRSPIGVWAPVEAASPPLAVVDRDGLRTFLTDRSEDLLPELAPRVAALRSRLFDVYGTQVHVADWHVEPIQGDRYRSDVHWSKVGELAGADLKRIWEPARFGWLFDLVRADLVDADLGGADLFWEIFDEWCDANPPNTGVHWACGQEASLRLIAISACASVFDGTPGQWGRLTEFAWQTAARVESNIAYAQSQDNNHASSEAAGLLTAALLFPGSPASSRWIQVGEDALADVCERLIFADGGSSQYSTNYHRLFVHTLTWVVVTYQAANREVPDWLLAALKRSAEVLGALAHPEHGEAPFFGADDGTRLLPLTFGHPYTHVGPDVELARAVIARAKTPSHESSSSEAAPEVADSRSEALTWFGLASIERSTAIEPIQSFPDFGVHILQHGAFRVVIRCGTATFRPSHDDQLHMDVWVDGDHVIRDSRTASYKPRAGDPGSLREAEWHNGPRVLGKPAMVPASRFLWGYWPKAQMVSSTRNALGVSAQFRLDQTDGVRLTRSVALSASKVEIADRSSESGFKQTVWRTTPSPHVRIVSSGDLFESTGLVADGYGQSSECRTVTQVVDDSDPQFLCLRLEKKLQ